MSAPCLPGLPTEPFPPHDRRRRPVTTASGAKTSALPEGTDRFTERTPSRCVNMLGTSPISALLAGGHPCHPFAQGRRSVRVANRQAYLDRIELPRQVSTALRLRLRAAPTPAIEELYRAVRQSREGMAGTRLHPSTARSATGLSQRTPQVGKGTSSPMFRPREMRSFPRRLCRRVLSFQIWVGRGPDLVTLPRTRRDRCERRIG